MNDGELLHTPRGRLKLSRYGGTPRMLHTPRRRIYEKTFAELYSGFECDALGSRTITQLLLMEKEDFEKLPGFDTQKAQNMSVYRFLLYANKDDLYAGTANAREVAIRASQMREKSESDLLECAKRMKRSTPRSPKRKIRTAKQKKEDEKIDTEPAADVAIE